MSESKAKILVKNTKWIYISKIFSQLFSLVATILVIRQLAVDVFGTYNLLLTSFVVFEIFALSAVVNVLNRYVPELIANKEYKKFKKFIRKGFGFSFILFSFLIAILYLNKGNFASFFNIEHFDKYLLAFFIYNYAHFIQIVITTVLKALLLHKKTAIITIFTSALRLGLYLYFLTSLDVKLLLYIEALIGLIFLVCGIYIYIKHTAGVDCSQTAETESPVTFQRVKRYGLFSLLDELGVGFVGRTSDYFIVAALSNPYQVGLFAFAHRIYGLVYKILPFQDFLTVVRPLFFQKFSQKYDIEEFKQMCAFMIKMLLPVYVFPALYFLFFGKSIISTVFDTKYLEAYWVTVVILSGNLFSAFFYPVSLTTQLKERMDVMLYSKIVVIFSIAAGIYGMKVFGVIGVAFASVLGNLFKNLFILFLMRSYGEIKYRIRDYRNFLFMALCLAPFIFLQNIDLNIYTLILLSLLFAVYSIIIFMIFHPFNAYDFELLDKVAGSSKVLLRSKHIIATVYSRINIIKRDTV